MPAVNESGGGFGRRGASEQRTGQLRIFTNCAISTCVVNKAIPINQPAAQLEAQALRILREVPGLDVVAEPGEGPFRPDFLVTFSGARAPVAIEVKRHANAATAWQLLHDAEAHPDRPLLLVADETTEEARRILTEHGIGVVDGLGNAHLELPGLLVHLEARRRPRRQVSDLPPTRLRGKAGVAAQALLLDTERPWRVDDLAKVAGISKGLAHRVLARLAVNGVLRAEGTGPNRVRHVTNPTALLDLWAEESIDKATRTPGYVLAQTPQLLTATLATNLDRCGFDYALTGAAAASRVAPFITAVPVVDVWVTERTAPKDLFECVHADPAPDGNNVVFLQQRGDAPLAFREKLADVWLANLFRIYADLRRDPRRGREQADNLRKEVIGL